jgi:hypothetical protein
MTRVSPSEFFLLLALLRERSTQLLQPLTWLELITTFVAFKLKGGFPTLLVAVKRIPSSLFLTGRRVFVGSMTRLVDRRVGWTECDSFLLHVSRVREGEPISVYLATEGTVCKRNAFLPRCANLGCSFGLWIQYTAAFRRGCFGVCKVQVQRNIANGPSPAFAILKSERTNWVCRL